MVGPGLPAETMQDTGQQLFTSLLLLGLDAAALEHSLRTPVNQKMFVRMNKKLGEHILHFLFVTIDRDRAAKVFRDCWPMVDRKQEAVFHKATFEWYKSLQQTYGQMVPSVVAKTFMVPGGPKFTSTLTALTRVALHSSITRKAQHSTLLSFPTFSRNASQNRETLQLLRSFKHLHYRNYITKQTHRERLIKSFQIKVREAVSRYRNACSESEKATHQVKELLHTNTSLTQHQRDHFPSMTVQETEKEIFESLAAMNASADMLWKRVGKFHQVEESSWKILAPLLDGSTLSYIDGSKYTPRIPETIFKEHANTINKLGVEGGVYEGEQLNLLSLIHYSNLALTSLLNTFTAKHKSSPPDPISEVDVQRGRVSSLKETVTQLSGNLSSLLPTLQQSVASARLSATTNLDSTMSGNATLGSLGLDGKPHLCPPTPPFNLMNTPVQSDKSARRRHQLMVQLTPGITRPKLGPKVNLNPNFESKLEEGIQTSSHFSHSEIKQETEIAKNGSLDEDMEEESEGLSADVLSVDCRGRYLQQKEKERELLKSSQNNFQATKYRKKNTKIPIKKSAGKEKQKTEVTEVKKDRKVLKEANVKVKRKNITVSKESSLNSSERSRADRNDPDIDYTLLEKLTNMVANDEDDSGTAELLTTQIWQESSGQSGNTQDSGCLEMTSEDTLIEAVEMMNITPNRQSIGQQNHRGTPRSHRGTPRQSLTPLQNQQSNRCTPTKSLTPLQNQRSNRGTPTNNRGTPPVQNPRMLEKTVKQKTITHPRLSRLIDATPCGPIKYDGELLENNTDLFAVEESIESPLDKTEVEGEKYQDLLPRMVFLTQEPVKSASPVSSKVQSIFTELGLNLESNGNLESSQGNGYVNGSSYNPRDKVNILFEQIKQLKLMDPPQGRMMNGQNGTEKSGSKFLSFVENIKNGRQSVGLNTPNENQASKKNIKSSVMEEKLISVEEEVNGDTIDRYFKSMAKGQVFEESGDDSSILEKTVKEVTEEKFACNLDEVNKLLNDEEKPSRSSLLPLDSVFDTIGDSILYGESSQALLQQDQVISEIRRESIASRRQSVASNGRLSLGSGKGPERQSALFSCLSQDCSGILDESDSCLLNISMEDF